MGGSVSSGRNNDELVDNLVKGGLIKTQLIERVFRAVDRGIFYLPKFKDAAYRDLAWREGRIHISAPCIYTRYFLLKTCLTEIYLN
jgi:protein-L-isoaspartate O-methyltransferase